MSLAIEDFGGEVFGRAHKAPCLLIFAHIFLGEAKVGEHGEAFGVYEYVFWFQAEYEKSNLVIDQNIIIMIGEP